MLILITSSLILLTLASYITYRFYIIYRLKKWIQGDMLYVKKADKKFILRTSQIHPSGEPMVLLLGWSFDKVLVSLYNGEKWFLKRSGVKNISLEIRENDSSIEKFMNKLYKVEEIETSDVGLTYNGKPLKLCTKEELEVVLETVVETEQYELAVEVRDLINNNGKQI